MSTSWDCRVVCRRRLPHLCRRSQEAAGQLNLVTDYLGTGQHRKPLEVFSADFTQLSYAEGARKAHLMAVVDIGSRCTLGWAVGPSANRELALRCCSSPYGAGSRCEPA